MRDSKTKSIITITVIYLFAGMAGIFLNQNLPFEYWLNLLIADVAGTILVFVFSVLFANASVYDPYWSVFPMAAITVYSIDKELTQLNILHLTAIWFWGIRLTGNWAATFRNLNHQDWRYSMLQERTGKLYPLVNFLGIHLVPTLIVYFCVIPAIYAIKHHLDGGIISELLVLVSMGAAVMQWVADHQMHVFRKEHQGELIRTGLWTYSRHPNYFGEILMWWGIGLSVVLSIPGNYWLLTGAVINTLLFVFISIPMAEERQSRKSGYEEYVKETRMLLPVKPR